MDRWLIALMAGLVGGAASGVAVHVLTPRSDAVRAGDDSADARHREIRNRLIALEAAASRPPPALAAPVLASGQPGAEADARGTGPGSAAAGGALAKEEIEAIATRAAEIALEKRGKVAGRVVQKEVTLAEAARELELTTTQEEELGRIYAEMTEKGLKMMAEPESDAESLRRELDAAKDDPAKKAAIAGRLIPKFFTKLGDVMAIEAEKRSRIRKVLGPEKAAKFETYDVVEEDPWGIGDAFMIGATATTGE